MRKTLVMLVLVLAAGAALRGDDARTRRIGEQLICTCGCTQNAMTCNHVGCPVVTQMQAEIRQRAASTDSDELVLQSFVQEYGTQVIANPTHVGFNRIAWIMPWVALGLGLALVLFFVKRWQHEPAAAGMAPPPTAVQARVQADIEAATREFLDS
ncbi:MAG TPA: cytochrome c-type biogenesis protein CcmH [Terriglobales bacterium]|nr:cytochrome c-type biogenesis protein CcmH [Terriglobales bacterium]